MYYINKYGLLDHQKRIGNNDPIFLERLVGYLHFWHSVEPKNKFVNKSLESLSFIREEIHNNDIGIVPEVPDLVFDEYQLVFE